MEDLSHNDPGAASSVAPLRGLGETLVLIALTLAVLVPGIGKTDFVQTEALRAVVAKEMLETGRYLVPQVHHEPYTRKPPLFAWQLVGVSRLTGTAVCEPLARSLSVFAVVIYVVSVYWGAALLFTRPCAMLAGSMALCAWVVLDYGTRAELDMTFVAWVTVSQLCLYAALRHRGAGQWWAWSGVYFAASVATLAKGPHAVIFLALTATGWSWRRGGFYWLLRPAHLVPAAIAFVVVVGWAVSMALYAGPSQYGRSALIELFIRLVPYKTAHFLSWFWNVPAFAFITLPASVPALAMVFKAARPREGTRDRSAVTFLLIWLVTNLAFLTFAPAKASRYMLPVFAPVALLGALSWRMFLDGTLPAVWDRVIRRFSAAVFAVGLVCGFAGVVLAILLARTGRIIVWPVDAESYPAVLLAGALAMSLSLAGLYRLQQGFRTRVWWHVALLVILIRPVQVAVYNPLREARYSQRALAHTLDRHVPPGQPVLVYGSSPMPDLEMYSRRHFAWPDRQDPNVAKDVVDGRVGYFIVRRKKDWEAFRQRLHYAIRRKIELPMKHDSFLLVAVDFSCPGGPSAALTPSTDASSRPAAGVNRTDLPAQE